MNIAWTWLLICTPTFVSCNVSAIVVHNKEGCYIITIRLQDLYRANISELYSYKGHFHLWLELECLCHGHMPLLRLWFLYDFIKTLVFLVVGSVLWLFEVMFPLMLISFHIIKNTRIWLLLFIRIFSTAASLGKKVAVLDYVEPSPKG